MKLPLFNKYGCPDKYVEQLIAENHLNGLLEGYTLKYIVPRLIDYIMVKPRLVLKGGSRIKHIVSAMIKAIQR